MIELVFVIVVIGILSAIALPRFTATRTDAVIAKGRSQIASIRSGISMQKSRNMLQGERQTNSYYPDNLDNATYNTDGENLFYFSDGNESNILEYPIVSLQDRDGHWVKTAANEYAFFITADRNVTFDYNSTTGRFACSNSADCRALTQ